MTRSRIVTVTPNPALDLWTVTDSVLPGPKLRCAMPEEEPGGGGINVARMVARLGGTTLALYAAGGVPGAAIAAALDREGVPALQVPTAGSTRQSFSVQEAQSGLVWRFVTPGPPLEAAEVAALQAALAEAAGDAAIVVGSGSLPPGMDPRFWADCAATARKAGARFVLDSGAGAAEALETGLFMFRENADVIARLAGRPLTWPEGIADWAATRIAAGQAEIVVATDGAKGALMVTPRARVTLTPPQVATRSAIGAGDSFVAGFCHALAAGATDPDALRMAVATAAATLLSPGTALCRREDALRLMEEGATPQPF